MNDQELEQRLRSWYKAEVPTDLAAPADLRSKVVTIPRPTTQSRRRSNRPRGFTLLAAAALTGLLAGTALVGGMLGSRPDPVVRPTQPPFPSERAAIASPSPTPQGATPSPMAGPCLTDTMTVLTGEATRAMTGIEIGDSVNLGPARGVYIGGSGINGGTGIIRRGIVWSVGPGEGPARPIAAIVDPPIVFDVVDLSSDGTSVLMRAGTLSINSPEPECVDLYAVRTDGSGATRLTPFRGGRSVSGAAFSPDGTRVAYSGWGLQGDAITVLDLGSGRSVDQPCGATFGFTLDRIEWSPTGDRVAAACSGIVTVFDAGGARDPAHVQSTSQQLLFGWTDAGDLLVSTDRGDILSFDVESQTSTTIGQYIVHDMEQVSPSAGGFSPDGRWLVFQGVRDAGSAMVGFLVPTSGGTPTRILNEDEASSTIAWSTDGRTLIAAHETGRSVEDVPEQVLGGLDPGTLRWSEIGPLLNGQGVWQIPREGSRSWPEASSRSSRSAAAG